MSNYDPSDEAIDAANDTIPHQTAVEGVVQDVIDSNFGEAADFVAAASTAHALNATFSDTEVETALNALGAKINSILTVLINAGLMEAS